MKRLELEEEGGIAESRCFRMLSGDVVRFTIDWDRKVSVEAEEPYAGDTETGIGRSATVRISKEQVEKLIAWLLDALGEM